MTNQIDDLRRKEYIDSPQYWARQHIIGKAYNVDKYTLNRFIEALEWQITEYEQLQKRFEECKEEINLLKEELDSLKKIEYDLMFNGILIKPEK